MRLALLLAAFAVLSCEGEPARQTEIVGNTGDNLTHPDAARACGHNPCATGAKLSSHCDPCVTKICAQDSFCCSSKWDAQCVNEVASVCNESCGGGGGGGGGGTGGGGGGGTGGGGGGGTGGGGGGGGTGGALMKFAVFGDCRPPNINGTANYPSAIVGGVFSLAQSLGAQFVVGTGDYMFASTTNQTAVDDQVALFQQARANYSGPVYLAMGNHECTGATASNCPNANETPNVIAFMSKLAPPSATKPYFRVDVATPLGKAKFIFVAANAWSSAQQSWLQTQLADPTTYTFVARHEPAADTSAPGVSPSNSLIQAAPHTLELWGHTHEYKHVSTNQVISGNAGAPLQSGATHFGLLLVEQKADGNLTVTELDESTGQANDTWSVTPSGAAN